MKKITLTYYALKTVTLDVTKLDDFLQRKFALLEKDEYKMTEDEMDDLNDFLEDLNVIVEEITGDTIMDEVDIDDFE